MREERKYQSHGIGFVGALQILFIALKLLEKITWSWFWVLSPIWIEFLLLIILGIILEILDYERL